MKKISLLAVSALVLFSCAISSCSKVKEAIAKNIPNITYQDDKPVISIPASSSTAQQTAFGTINFDLSQFIASNAGTGGIDFSYVKHIYVKSIKATLVNADANNNFNNLAFTAASSPAVIFNTTPDVNNATLLGGNMTTPPSDPYNLVIPVTNNADILSHVNGKNWSYGFTYKLQKPTTKDLQVKLDVEYEISFKN